MAASVRWGVLGTGKIARIIATALSEGGGGELVAVGSRDAERAKSFAAEFGLERSGEYGDVIEDRAVDLVYVGTNHPMHREWAVHAADAGKHVLCEKPMAMDEADAAQIVAAARRNGVFLAEAFAYRCHPQTARLLDLLRQEAVGEVRLIDAVFGYDAGPQPTNYLLVHELGGGSILDVGCYTTSMAHLIASVAAGGSARVPTVAAAGRLGPTGVDHSAAANLAFPGGPIARLACSIEADLESSVRVYGSRGRITVPSPWLPGRIGTAAEIVVERHGAEPEKINIPLAADVYAVEIDAVNAAVRAGVRSPSWMTWEDSQANMRILDRWRAAIGLRY